MDSTEHALNCFLSSKSAASTEIARDCGVSYVSWIKAKYGNKVEEVLRDEEDLSQWQKDFDESNTKLAEDSVEAQGATERQTEEDEMKDIDLAPEKGYTRKEALFFHNSVKIDNFYIDGENNEEGDADLSGYMPSGLGSANQVAQSEQEQHCLHDGMELENLEEDEIANKENEQKIASAATGGIAGQKESEIETLLYSDDEVEENADTIEQQRIVEPDGTDGGKSNRQAMLEALAELRRTNPRYADISDAELLAEIEGNTTVHRTSNNIEDGNGSCAGTGSSGAGEGPTRWYEDVEAFTPFDD